VARRPLPRAVPRPPPEGHRVSKLPPTLAPSYYDLFESLFLLSASSVSAMRVCDQLYRLNSVFTDIVVWRVNPCLLRVMFIVSPFLFLGVGEMLVRFLCGVR
jgi:hypothetical protein